jgi:hypothetical protein
VSVDKNICINYNSVSHAGIERRVFRLQNMLIELQTDVGVMKAARYMFVFVFVFVCSTGTAPADKLST